MRKLEPQPETDILSGWKEIAQLFGRSAKTVQRRERDEGLPIIRPRGPRGPVYASRRAIALWLKGYIESVALTDDQLIAFGRGGRPLWSYPFPTRLRSFSKQELSWRLQIVDLHGNGVKGVVAAVQFHNAEEEDKLRYFDNEGQLVWETDVVPDLCKADDRPFERAWTIKHVLVLPETQSQSIWVAVANSAGWGGSILRFDADDIPTLRFANAGHIERLDLATVYDERCLVFCGENNDFDQAFVALLGLIDPLAYSVPGKRSVYRFANASAERPRKLILFPKSELIEARQKPYGHTTALRLYKDRIIVHVETGGEGAELLYHFTPDLEPMYVFPSGSHEFAHQELERKHQLKHAWAQCPELKKPMSLRIWTANTGWNTRAIPWRDYPWKDD